MVAFFWISRSFPLISVHLSRAGRWTWGKWGRIGPVLGVILMVWRAGGGILGERRLELVAGLELGSRMVS